MGSYAKVGKIRAIAHEISCPYCEAIIPSTSGSHFWTNEELEIKAWFIQTCGNCVKTVSIPLLRKQRIAAKEPK